jgi:hypothetical protein
MKADGLLISAEELPWRNPISACRSRLNECFGDFALVEVHNYLSARTELSEAPPPLSSMHTRIQAKEPATPDQTLLVLLAQTGDRAALDNFSV